MTSEDQQLLREKFRQAVAHLEAGRFDAAESLARELTEQYPDSADAMQMLGYLACRGGRFEEGIRHLRRALEIEPDSSQALCHLGNAYLRVGEAKRAEQSFAAARKLAPDDAESCFGLGESLRIQEQFDAAEAAYRDALRLQPEHWAAAELANLYERANRADEARPLLGPALAQAPDNPLANLVAAKCERRAGRVEDATNRLVGLLDRSPGARGFKRIHFELGRLYDQAGDPERAFEHFRTGNELAAREWRVSNPGSNEALRDAGSLLERYTPQWVAGWSDIRGSPENPAPVFLVGFPRSGTTLLDRILDSHPEVQVLEEQPTVSVVEDRVSRMPAGYPEALADVAADDLDELVEVYFRCAHEYVQRGSTGTIVDKLPLNLTRAGLIHRLFPQARIILAVRHPCDVVLSCFMQNFGLNPAMANFFTIEATVRFYDVLMKLWCRYTELFPLRVHAVRYEDVVADIATECRRLTDFLELPWNPAMLSYHERAQQRSWIRTPSYHQASRPVYTRAVDRWKRYSDRLEPFLSKLQPHIEKYGYGGV